MVMIEYVEPVGSSEVEIRSAAFPWQHVRKVGEDIVAGELLLPQQHRIRPADVGALLAGGVLEVPVYGRPKVWIQPTGTELVSADEAALAEPGQIIEFNGAILSGLVREGGGEAFVRDIIRDDYESHQAGAPGRCRLAGRGGLVQRGVVRRFGRLHRSHHRLNWAQSWCTGSR